MKGKASGLLNNYVVYSSRLWYFINIHNYETINKKSEDIDENARDSIEDMCVCFLFFVITTNLLWNNLCQSWESHPLNSLPPPIYTQTHVGTHKLSTCHSILINLVVHQCFPWRLFVFVYLFKNETVYSYYVIFFIKKIF